MTCLLFTLLLALSFFNLSFSLAGLAPAMRTGLASGCSIPPTWFLECQGCYSQESLWLAFYFLYCNFEISLHSSDCP